MFDPSFKLRQLFGSYSREKASDKLSKKSGKVSQRFHYRSSD